MADNVILNPGVGGANVATDEISGVHYQRIKLIHGSEGASSGDVSIANPLPVDLPLASDMYTGALQTIDWEHSRIHYGKGFLANGKHSVAFGATSRFLLRNGVANYPHLRTIFITSTTGPMDVVLYENPVVTTIGTAIPVINYNRNSLTTSVMEVYEGTNVSVTGIILETMLIPGSKTQGGSDATAQVEFILKPSTDYLLEIVNNTAGNGTTDYTLKLFWYEN